MAWSDKAGWYEVEGAHRISPDDPRWMGSPSDGDWPAPGTPAAVMLPVVEEWMRQWGAPVMGLDTTMARKALVAALEKALDGARGRCSRGVG